MARTFFSLLFQTSANISPPTPVDPVSGSVTVTYEPTTGASGLVDAISLTLGHNWDPSEVGWQYESGNLTVGGLCCPSNQADDVGAGFPEDDWLLQILLVTPVVGVQLQYHLFTGDGNLYDAQTVSVITPEPSTLALFATGLALLAFLGWRRRGSKWLRAA